MPRFTIQHLFTILNISTKILVFCSLRSHPNTSENFPSFFKGIITKIVKCIHMKYARNKFIQILFIKKINYIIHLACFPLSSSQILQPFHFTPYCHNNLLRICKIYPYTFISCSKVFANSIKMCSISLIITYSSFFRI